MLSLYKAHQIGIFVERHILDQIPLYLTCAINVSWTITYEIVIVCFLCHLVVKREKLVDLG